MITFDDFKKVEIKIGTIITAEPVEGSEKLLKLIVDFGLKSAESLPVIQENSETEGSEDTAIEEVVVVEDVKDVRTVVSGIAKYVDVETLPGKQFAFITNLEPRPIMGIESQAMILAAKDDADFAILTPSKQLSPGASVS
jgi:tRNA-binding EMAP/Myf-like protein